MIKAVLFFLIASTAHSVSPIERIESLVKLEMSVRAQLVDIRAEIKVAKDRAEAAQDRLDDIEHCVGLTETFDGENMESAAFNSHYLDLIIFLNEEMKNKSRMDFCGLLMDIWRKYGDKDTREVVVYFKKIFLSILNESLDGSRFASMTHTSLADELARVQNKIGEIPDRHEMISEIIKNLNKEKEFIEARYLAIETAIDEVYTQRRFPNIAIVISPLSKQQQLVTSLFKYPSVTPESDLVSIIADSVSKRGSGPRGRQNLRNIAKEVSASRKKEIAETTQLLQEYLKISSH
jgi:hypothetical protein